MFKRLFLIICFSLFLLQNAKADSWQTRSYNYTNINTTATTYIKTGGTLLHSVTINKPVASSVISIDDGGGVGSTPVAIGSITIPATLLAQGPYTAIYDVTCVNGLVMYTTVAASDITVAWQ